MPRKLKTIELQRLTPNEYRQADKIPAIIVLDNIRSAYNVGAIFRTADGFRLQAIHLCGITPKPDHKEVYKTAIGAEHAVEWSYFENPIDSLLSLKNQGFTLIAIEQCDNSSSLLDFKWNSGTKFAIILGNEVEGISSLALERCDHFIEIPQYGTKHSLNVAVACGIVLWDMVKTTRPHDPASLALRNL
jgi:23S rRNA (guanosine2251-2'-O)-methyltransferase